jgi:predicted RNA binding protein YcfA (HicA-like mRNA interferase family)
MSRKQKRYDKICGNLRAQSKVTFDDLKTLLESYGFTLERSKGSHHHFSVKIGGRTFTETIPRKNPVRKIYVKSVCALIAKKLDYERAPDNDNNDTY